MKVISLVRNLTIGAALATGYAMPALADGGDSSADAGSFTEVVKAAKGVIIQVPINEQGQELPDQADIRVYGGDTAIESNTQAIAAAFAGATPAADVPEITQADIDRDSSTSWGWFGGYRGHGRGWSSGYYYYDYRPSYYAYGNYYRCGNPYYYNNYSGYSYGGHSYYGSRYYYYPYY